MLIQYFSEVEALINKKYGQYIPIEIECIQFEQINKKLNIKLFYP